MEKFNNVVKLTLQEALQPDVEELYKYDCILLPMNFKTASNLTISLLYKPLRNVYYYESY